MGKILLIYGGNTYEKIFIFVAGSVHGCVFGDFRFGC